MEATIAYCVKCKAKNEMVNGKEVPMKSKGPTPRRAMTGQCKTCNTTMYKILASKK